MMASSGGWHCRYRSLQNMLRRDQSNTELNMPRVSGNSQKRNAQKPFRSDLCNLQRVERKALPFLLSRNTLYGPPQSSHSLAPQDGGTDFACQIEKVPVRPFDLARQLLAI